jgi:hypothetical protein
MVPSVFLLLFGLLIYTDEGVRISSETQNNFCYQTSRLQVPEYIILNQKNLYTLPLEIFKSIRQISSCFLYSLFLESNILPISSVPCSQTLQYLSSHRVRKQVLYAYI